MKYLIINLSVLFLSVIIISCSDLEQNISPAAEIATHGSGVFNPSAPNYHGKLVLDSPNKFVECQRCHAADFSGGVAEIGCNIPNCHPTIGVHKEGITNPTSENFHAKFLKINNTGMAKCTQCHGDHFSGGLASPTCVDCHSGIGVHKSGFLNPGSPDFHGKFIEAKNWNLEECSQCHNSDYSGGLVSPTCLTCHNQPDGPEACNTCHGVFDDPTKIAPEMGAHSAHLYSTDNAKLVECVQCHSVPTDFATVGHIDNTSAAEIIFGDFAKLKTNSLGAFAQDPTLPEFVPNPAYTISNGSCASVYCHGYFKNGNTNNVVAFDGGESEIKCGSCHGDVSTGNPRPKITTEGGSHPNVQDCSLCHGDVVSVTGTTYTIIDKEKHINGKLNLFGNEETY